MDEKTIPAVEQNPPRKRYFSLLIIVAVVVGLDQWTKWLVREDIPLNTSWLPESLSWLSPYARITYIQNSGSSFGMFQNGKVFLIILAVLVIIGAIYNVADASINVSVAMLLLILWIHERRKPNMTTPIEGEIL